MLLAACGGGGGGSSSVVPGTGSVGIGGSATPTPTPTPVTTPTPTPIPGAGQPLSGTRTYRGSWGPPAVAQDLDFPVQHHYDGTGQTIAVVIDSDVSRADLTAFFQYFQIPTTGRTITSEPVRPLTHTSVITVKDQNAEATLDVETVAGLAPGANIIIYQMQDLSDQSLINAYNQVISEGKAFIVNNSFGGCDESGTTGIDPVLQSGAQKGIAFLFSSGDTGNVCDNTTKPMTVGPSYPGDSPYALGIGGNETLAGSSLTTPIVWNDHSCSSGQCASGGGVSSVYSIPSYQQGVAGTASQTHRNSPDFSMPAEDVAVYYNSTWHDLLGTSWSAPEATALFAELYQYCGARGRAIAGVTNPATIPYYVASQSIATNFTDVTGGNDQFNGLTPFYSGAAGYDDATGFGVPKGWTFTQTACPGGTPAGTLARTSMSEMFSMASTRPARDLTLDVTPRVTGLADEGPRAGSAETPIQFVLLPNSNMAAGEAAIVSALQSAGFTLTQRFSNHLVVDASAPAATVNRFFRTSIHNVAQGRYGTRYLPSTQIVVPASIAPYVAGVSLDNVVKYHTLLH
jgi:subtilase family serine protease